MTGILVLSASDVRKLAIMRDIINAVEEAFRASEEVATVVKARCGNASYQGVKRIR